MREKERQAGKKVDKPSIEFHLLLHRESLRTCVTGQRKVSSTFNVMCNRLVRSVYTLIPTLPFPLCPITSNYGIGEKEKKKNNNL